MYRGESWENPSLHLYWEKSSFQKAQSGQLLVWPDVPTQDVATPSRHTLAEIPAQSRTRALGRGPELGLFVSGETENDHPDSASSASCDFSLFVQVLAL